MSTLSLRVVRDAVQIQRRVEWRQHSTDWQKLSGSTEQDDRWFISAELKSPFCGIQKRTEAEQWASGEPVDGRRRCFPRWQASGCVSSANWRYGRIHRKIQLGRRWMTGRLRTEHRSLGHARRSRTGCPLNRKICWLPETRAQLIRRCTVELGGKSRDVALTEFEGGLQCSHSTRRDESQRAKLRQTELNLHSI